MKEINLAPLIVESVRTFFASSRDALERARNAKSSQAVLIEPTGLNIFEHRHEEKQASLECIVFSFLAVEACINYLFFREHHGGILTISLSGSSRSGDVAGFRSTTDSFYWLTDLR
jgi:hypothetical protein